MKRDLPKIFHIEAVAEDYILIGTDIRARNREEAEQIMKLTFRDKVNKQTIFFLISENILH